MPEPTYTDRLSAFTKHFRVPLFERLAHAAARLSFVERMLFYAFAGVFAASGLALLYRANDALLVVVPTRGGEIVEGVAGAPRFINPLLASSNADRDLTQLVYSGLLKADPDGSLAPDLAESYAVSPDGLSYTFTLREGARFHDGEPVTSADIAYTIALAQNAELKSPRRASWDGVSVETPDPRTAVLRLPAPYQPFLENATLGILPKHLWEAIPPEQHPFAVYNTEAVGSGPYEVAEVKRDGVGVPTRVSLEAFSGYLPARAFIDRIVFKFYRNEDELAEALERGDAGGASALAPEAALEALDILGEPESLRLFALPRVFGVFFNQSRAEVFTDIAVRAALAEAVDRETLVQEVLSGLGEPVEGPLPPQDVGHSMSKDATVSNEARLASARDILERNGWKQGGDGVYAKKSARLAFSLATANTPELRRAGEVVVAAWRALGADVELKLFDTGILNSEVIRPREYDALLFGHITGRSADPFPFWHSSQRNDPGLNIALYANIEVDAILERIRRTFDAGERDELRAAFESALAADIPAVFLYSPDLVYLADPRVNGIEVGLATTPAERFLNVAQWHINTQKVWEVFAGRM